MEKAKLLSAYDGAALVYARNQALSYLGKSDPPAMLRSQPFTTQTAAFSGSSHTMRLQTRMVYFNTTNFLKSHIIWRSIKSSRRAEGTLEMHRTMRPKSRAP